MKYSNLLLLPFAIALIHTAHAATNPKQVTIPFTNEAIISNDHNGLAFNYDLSGQPAKKIICKLSNTYKAWFTFPLQGAIQESNVYGEHQIVIFRPITNTPTLSENISVYSVDMQGPIKINDVDQGSLSHATAACYYKQY